MRILLLITQLELAGAQKAILELARGLAQAGHEVVVVTCYDKGEYVSYFAEQYEVEVITLAMKGLAPEAWFRRLWRLLRGLSRLFILLRQRRIQILQSYTHYSNWLGPIIGRLAGVPHCVTSQRGPLKLLPRWAVLLDRWINNSWLVDKMVSVSKATLEECQANGIRQEKLLVIRNGVDLGRYAHAPDGSTIKELRAKLHLSPTDRVVLTVARLHPQKGHHTLLQAVRQVVDHLPEVKFVWVGDGELAQELQQACATHSLEANILMVGAQAHVQPYYQLAELFVLPSHWEGLPNVLLEAAIAGLPMVVTRVGGVAEIVPDDAGYLVPPQCPDALAEAILVLLGDPVRCQQMSERATLYVRQTFKQNSNLQSYLKFYHDLVADE